MSDQKGIFYRGTFGFPIEVQLGIPLNDATSIDLTLIKPGPLTLTGSPTDGAVINRVLPFPDCIISIPNGTAQFIPAIGEIDLPGRYRFVLGIHFGTGKLLEADGEFLID